MKKFWKSFGTSFIHFYVAQFPLKPLLFFPTANSEKTRKLIFLLKFRSKIFPDQRFLAIFESHLTNHLLHGFQVLSLAFSHHHHYHALCNMHFAICIYCAFHYTMHVSALCNILPFRAMCNYARSLQCYRPQLTVKIALRIMKCFIEQCKL